MTVTTNQKRVAAFRAVSATESSSQRPVHTAMLIFVLILLLLQRSNSVPIELAFHAGYPAAHACSLQRGSLMPITRSHRARAISASAVSVKNGKMRVCQAGAR